MTRVQTKDLARLRTRYTGETYQQAQGLVAAVSSGEALLPDAHSGAQAAVESAVLNRLLTASRMLSVDTADECLPLPVQAVRPLPATLRVTVPINAVEQFAAMLCASDTTSDGESLMVTSTRDVVTVALPDQADAQVQLRCSWERLRTVLRAAPGVEILSGGRLRVRGAAQPRASRPEHSAALSACLRRVMLFSDPGSLSWLVAWNEWVASDRRHDRPAPPYEVLAALTKSRFGPTSAAVCNLLVGGPQSGFAGALPRRPSRGGGDLGVGTTRGGAPFSVSPDMAFTGVTFTLSATELQRLVAQGALPDTLNGSTHPASDPALAAPIRAAMRRAAPMADDLVEAGLGATSMIMGFQLPLTSRQVDVVLAGVHPESGDDSYVVVELKSWTHAQSLQGSDSLVAVGRVGAVQLHPSVQVSAYCEYLSDVLGVPADGDGPIRGASYLYNAVDRDVSDLLTRRPTNQSPTFTKQRRVQFLDHLRAHLGSASGAGAAERLLASPARASRRLLTYAEQELKERSHFRLLDEQRVAYELVLRAVERARTVNRKTVVVVAGGPGSGKSVIGLSALGELVRQGRSVLHATGSRSFTQTLRRYVGRGSSRVRNMFAYFNSFMATERNSFDVLICDEAHRIRATSVNRFTPKIKRDRARAQIDELVEAARVPVFLLDEDQIVKPGETGSLTLISRYAAQRGLEIEVVSLQDQFRCGGSSIYDQWTNALLGIHDREPMKWVGDGRFDLRMADSPEEMEAFLADKQAGGETARISAGYCWPWSDPQPDESLVPDVQVGGWARPWNLRSDRSVGDAPGSAFWATDPGGFGQVGSVYTAQGFEYDWSGVIIGPDLIARDGRLVTRRLESKDPAFRSRQAVSDEAVDRFIRNTYRVLMTRGMRGTVLYSTDPETQAFLASRM